eukprot:EG_transcript_26468
MSTSRGNCKWFSSWRCLVLLMLVPRTSESKFDDGGKQVSLHGPEKDDFNGSSCVVKNTSKQYIFFRPRCCSGLNNQIEELWYAMQLAAFLGRGIVVPMVAENVTWDDEAMTRLAPLDLFYDVRVLSCFVPTIPLAHWRRQCNATFALHVFPKGREHPMQEQYEDVLNITWRGVPRLVVDSYLDLLERQLPDCLSVQWPAWLLNGTLTPRSYPGDPPFGALAERSAYFRSPPPAHHP